MKKYEMKQNGKNFYGGLSFYRASVKKLYHFVLFQTLLKSQKWSKKFEKIRIEIKKLPGLGNTEYR